MSELIVRLNELARQATMAEGCALVDLQYVKEGKTWFLRLFMEREDGTSTNLEDCTKVSDRLEGLLDVHNPIPQSYRLEVSSPGLDRVLKKRDDFMRFAGNPIALTTFEPVPCSSHEGGIRKIRGMLRGIEGGPEEGGKVIVMMEAERLAIPLDNVGKARLALDIMKKSR